MMERLWVDVFAGCTNVYYGVFHFLEDVGLFPIEQMFRLHYVFLPRHNRVLQQFRHRCNNHPMRIEHNRTPIQLYIQGLLLVSSGRTETETFLILETAMQ